VSTSADNIMVFDPSKGYTTYFLYYSAKANTVNNNKWVLNPTTPSSVKLGSGGAFWLNVRTTNESIQVPATFLGQVPNESAKSFSITNGYNMLSCKFAADWDPNTNGTAFWQGSPALKGAVSTSADNIMVFNPGKGYTTYFLYYSAKANTVNNYKWVSGPTTVAPVNFVKMGQGVWYNCRVATPMAPFEVPINRPYTLD
jgi:trehalose utilization protein